MLHLEIVDSLSNFTKLRPVWKEILSATDADNPFLTFEWLFNWWKNFGRKNNLLILLIKKNHEIVGILPLMKAKKILRGVSIPALMSIANNHTNRAGFLLVDYKEDAVSLAINYLLKSSHLFSLLYFPHVVQNSDTDIYLQEALKVTKLFFIKKNDYFSPFIPIEGTWERYRKGRSRNLKKKLSKLNRIFNNIGNFEVINYRDTNIQGGVEEMFRVTRESWQYAGGDSVISNKDNMAFYKDLSAELSKNNWLDLKILRMDGTPIAFMYNLCYKNKEFSLSVGFDKNFLNISPGQFLLAWAIEESFHRKLDEYDFLGHNNEYKMCWTDSLRPHVEYTVFKNKGLGIMVNSFNNGLIKRIRNMLRCS